MTVSSWLRKPRFDAQCRRIEPELRVAPGVRHVNVRWLTIFQAVEEEPVASDPEQYRHALSLLL